MWYNFILETNKDKNKQMHISYHGVKLRNSFETNIKGCKKFHPSNININLLCFYLNYNGMHKHEKLHFSLHVIFNVCHKMFIYIIKHTYVQMLCILIRYSTRFIVIFVAFYFDYFHFTFYLLLALCMIFVRTFFSAYAIHYFVEYKV